MSLAVLAQRVGSGWAADGRAGAAEALSHHVCINQMDQTTQTIQMYKW